MVRISNAKEDLAEVVRVLSQSPVAMRSVELAERTRLPRRRVQAALKTLSDQGRAEWRPRFVNSLHYLRYWRLCEREATKNPVGPDGPAA